MKQLFNKICATLLIITLTFALTQDMARANVVMQSVNDALTSSTDLDSKQPDTLDNSVQTTPTVLYELKDKRAANIKHFRMSDNTNQAVVYSQPVHYLENGNWQEIDNTLSLESAQDSEDFSGYVNKNADFQVKLADNSSNNRLVKIQKGKYKLEFSLSNNSKNNSKNRAKNYNAVIKKENSNLNSNSNNKAFEVDVTSDTIAYQAITYNNSDIEYEITSTGLKENIIVNSIQSSYVYAFDINTNHLYLELKDNIITAYDSITKDIIYEIPAPFMYDAKNEFSPEVDYTLVKTNSGYQLTISANPEWINSADRTFPVVIDPIVKVKQVKGSISSSFISSKMDNTNFYSGYATLIVGVESSSYYNSRTLVKFTLPELEKGDIIQSAYLNLTEYDVTDTYIIGGWAKAYSAPEFIQGDPKGSDRRFKISIKVTYSDGTEKWKSPVVFNEDIVGWQYAARTINLEDGTSANKTPSKITIYPRYDFQSNQVYFDKLSVIKDQVTTHSYNSDGNLTGSTSNADQSVTYEYYENTSDVKTATDAKGNVSSFDYTNHNLSSIKTPSTVQTNINYDNYGNPITLLTRNEPGDKRIFTETEYTADGAYVSKIIDQDGYEASYSYDGYKGLLHSVTNAKGKTEYTYDPDTDQLTSVSASVGDKTINNSYEYILSTLSKIKHNGFYYNFLYDSFGNNTEVRVGGQKLVSYTYDQYNGSLNSITYGNLGRQSYTYDEYGNVTKVTVDNETSPRYEWQADNRGSIIRHVDRINQLLYHYEYDFGGRLIRQSVEDTSKSIGLNRNLYLLEYGYDLNDNLSRFVNKAGKRTQVHEFGYNNEDLLSTYTMPSGKSVTYSYDELNRLSGYQIGATTPVKVDYSYYTSQREADEIGSFETTKISEETVGGYGTRHTYDELGNIISVLEKQPGGDYEEVLSYKYDELSQLTRENDKHQNKTKVYTYDLGGNIISIKEYAYTTDENPASLVNTINYEYEDENWKDKLTSFNGQAITYDEIGNPLSYNGYTYGWSNGRELTTLTGNGITVSYTYGADGLRSTKTVNGIKTTYEYVNGLLLYEKKGDIQLHYSYDANGSLKGIQTVDSEGTATTYYVVTNIRGDATQIYDADGKLQVLYTYDSWGKILSVRDSNGDEITNEMNIGQLNSLRYRGYYYDTETGLYYLQSRYYNPEIGRFISSDNIEVMLEHLDHSIIAANLYAYCLNNPVNMIDSHGEFAITTAIIIGIGIGALIGGVVGGTYGHNKAVKNNVQKEERWKYVIGYGIGGAVVGGIIGGFVGYGAGVALGAKGSSGLVIKSVSKAITSISKNTIHHIMQSKHAWGNALKNATWRNVKALINTTMQKGSTTLINQKGKALVYEAVRNNVVVRYAVIDGIIRISDAWIKTR